MNTPQQKMYQKSAEHIIKQLKKRNMEGFYFDSSTACVDYIAAHMKENATFTTGGSMTLRDIGLTDRLKKEHPFIDRKVAQTPEELREIYSQIVLADYFLMSTNAITLNGELVNIDGLGNRVACLIYGPKEVFIVAGMNKVAADLETAYSRIRNFAAPTNAIRLNCKTPCATTGLCGHCHSEDCVCSQIVVTRHSRPEGRIKVFLIGESLGY